MDNQSTQWHRATGRLQKSIFELVLNYPDDSRLPSADSKAMAELAEETNWKAPAALVGWGREPVGSAHALGVMQLRLALDCSIGMAHLIGTDEVTTVYSPAALLRPVLEGAGRALWTLETGIGTRERILRGMNERLSSLYWQKTLPEKEVKTRATVRISQILDAGGQLGFHLTPSSRGRPRHFVPGPPSHRDVIKGLFDHRNDEGLAKSLTLLADSISHAGTLGLTAYLGMSDPPQLSGTPRKSILRMTASDANLMMTAALMALIRAGSERIELQGQPADDWVNSAERCMTTIQDVLAAQLPRIS